MGKKGRRDKAAKARSAAGAEASQAPTPDPEPKPEADPPASNAETETPSSPPTSAPPPPPPPPPRPSNGAHVRLGASPASFPPCDPRGAFYDDANDCLLAVDEDDDGPLVRCVALPPRGARQGGDSSSAGYPGDDDAARDVSSFVSSSSSASVAFPPAPGPGPGPDPRAISILDARVSVGALAGKYIAAVRSASRVDVVSCDGSGDVATIAPSRPGASVHAVFWTSSPDADLVLVVDGGVEQYSYATTGANDGRLAFAFRRERVGHEIIDPNAKTFRAYSHDARVAVVASTDVSGRTRVSAWQFAAEEVIELPAATLDENEDDEDEDDDEDDGSVSVGEKTPSFAIVTLYGGVYLARFRGGSVVELFRLYRDAVVRRFRLRLRLDEPAGRDARVRGVTISAADDLLLVHDDVRGVVGVFDIATADDGIFLGRDVECAWRSTATVAPVAAPRSLGTFGAEADAGRDDDEKDDGGWRLLGADVAVDAGRGEARRIVVDLPAIVASFPRKSDAASFAQRRARVPLGVRGDAHRGDDARALVLEFARGMLRDREPPSALARAFATMTRARAETRRRRSTASVSTPASFSSEELRASTLAPLVAEAASGDDPREWTYARSAVMEYLLAAERAGGGSGAVPLARDLAEAESTVRDRRDAPSRFAAGMSPSPARWMPAMLPERARREPGDPDPVATERAPSAKEETRDDACRARAAATTRGRGRGAGDASEAAAESEAAARDLERGGDENARAAHAMRLIREGRVVAALRYARRRKVESAPAAAFVDAAAASGDRNAFYAAFRFCAENVPEFARAPEFETHRRAVEGT